MAKEITSKIILERTYNIPLRKEFQKAPRWKRTKKAVTALRQFLQKHMKSANVKLGKELNYELWKHGIKNPPHHVKVSATKDEQGEVKAELFGTKKKVNETKAKNTVQETEEKETKKDDLKPKQKSNPKKNEEMVIQERPSEKDKTVSE